jgi:drug/metabolite transporter (DMT)-like permease
MLLIKEIYYMNVKNNSLIQIHLAVFLFGMSGLFGKLVSLPPIIIVLGRVVFSSLFLLSVILTVKQKIRLTLKKDYSYLVLQGLILAIHWVAFFKSIQISTVAIGLLTFSTFPVFVTFLEPWFFKEQIRLKDVILTTVTFTGVIFVIPSFQLANNLTQGALWGILSGLTFAILATLNRKYVKDYSSLVIAFYQQVVAAGILLPFLFLQDTGFSIRDLLLLALLGVVFTGISHTLFINSLKKIKAQTASIISCLEPVYGIVLAIFLVRELPDLRTILGGLIILGTAFYSTSKSQK